MERPDGVAPLISIREDQMSKNRVSNLSSYLSDILHLDRRLSRAIETGRSIQLSALELDLLCATGAYEALKNAAVEEQKRVSLQRLGISDPEATEDALNG
jgi:hypothetical protein